MPVVLDKELRLARAIAIEVYANVESELCYLFSALLNVPHADAAIVFFKIVNVGSRNAIISDLLEHVHYDKFDIYWHGQPEDNVAHIPRVPGLLRLIGALDSKRNEIVHWHPVTNSAPLPDGTMKRWEDYRPAFFWARGNATPITEVELTEFSKKAEFVWRSLWFFWRFIRTPHKLTEAERQTWHQIFQQPVTYPPSEAHPLYQKPKK